MTGSVTARLAAVAVAAFAVTVLTGCTSDVPTPPPPAPANAELILSPLTGWDSTVYTFCDHGHRVYQTAFGQGAGVAVVPADPSCAGGGQ